MMSRAIGACCAAALLFGWGCSSDSDEEPGPSQTTDVGTTDGESDVSEAGDAETTPDTQEADEDTSVVDVGPAPSGTRVKFDLEAAEAGGLAFYDAPYPMDARLDESGAPTLADIGNPNNIELIAGPFELTRLRQGYPQMPVIWMAFDAAMPEYSELDVIPAEASAPVMLVDVDPDSDERGRLIPLVARTMEPDIYLPENVVAFAPRPGFILRGRTTYALVVMRSFVDAEGNPLGVPQLIWDATNGVPSDAATEYFGDIWETLETLDVDKVAVAGATAFTTGDVVAELFDMSEQVRADYDAPISNLAVDPTDGAAHERFCEVHGTVTFPRFQDGEEPWDTGGVFQTDDSGALVKQSEISVKLVLSLPKGEMPAEGYPLVLYLHGSGGLSTQSIDRGAASPGTGPAPGKGPAHVLAPHGFATASTALPVNPERVPGASGIAYLNFNNLKAFRDTFRQGVLEQRLLLDALSALEIAPSSVEACDGLTLPGDATGFTFNVEPVFIMGQSMGGMYTNMLGAVEPRAMGLVPTGAGGFWSYFILVTSLIDGAGDLLGLLLGTDKALSFMHPTMHMLQTAWEGSEPFVYSARLAADPLPGHPRRAIYQPVGKDDVYFPAEVFDAISLAYGTEQAGDTIWDSLEAALALDGRGVRLDYPVVNNLVSGAESATAVVVQYDNDGILDGHHIAFQLDAVKYQYGCFLASLLATGTATVPAPAALGTPCPGL